MSEIIDIMEAKKMSNYSTAAKDNYYGYSQDPTTYMTFDEYEDLRENMNDRRKRRVKKDREHRAAYYKKQRIFGSLIMGAGIACLITGKFVGTNILEYFGGFVGLVGLYTVLTKQMILVDKYYLERQDKFNEY